MDTQSINNLAQVFTDNLTSNIPTIIFAIVVLLAGLLLCKSIKKWSIKFLGKLNIDQSVSNYISYIVYILSIFLTIIVFLSMIGIPIDTLVSIIAVMFLSIGIAFKATLENVGSGLILLFFKPFKTGDYIESDMIEGIVSDMHIFSTSLKTFDNKTIIVPNSKLTNQSITNYTKQDKRRVDIKLNLPYGTDIDLVINILNVIIKNNKLTLKEPESLIGISKFNENSIEISIRVWVKTDDYWDVYHSLMYNIEKELRKNNIDMNIPQKVIYDTKKEVV
ncbi:MAG: mechanosensitive ion channel [Clostridium sp.]|nr:mechanosensitive ion channel [Clostridium sp.]MBQ9000131.1 mechanosensitive ion channel [Clostridium sp.]